MGKTSAPKRPARVGVRKIITEYRLRITNLARALSVIVFLGVFAALSAVNSFAQEIIITQARVDWLAEKVFLERAVQTGTVEQKRDALFRIRNLESEEASRTAVPALADKAEIVRATAAFSVIFLPKDEALNVLLPLLTDKKELVRREAAYALGKVRNPNATNSLLQIFQKDKVSDVRNAVVVALGEIGDASAIDVLTAILQRKPKPEEEFLRRSAARSIGQIAQIIQTGKTEVLTPENFLPERYERIEKPKYLNLIETFPAFRNANNILIQTLQNPLEFADAKREAAFALGAIGDESSVLVLQTKLNDEDYYLAEISRESLRKIRLIETLRKLDNPNKQSSQTIKN